MSRASEVATEIKKQLYAMDKNLMFGLGSSDFSASTNSKGYPCLLFKVRGVKHKGYVEIALNEGMDLYEITLFTIRGSTKKIKYFLEDVYVDMLPDLLEEYAY